MTLVGRPAENHPQQVGKRGALDKVDDRRTPRALFDELYREFLFTLDAAASKENALTDHYYDIEADGLKQPWAFGRGASVWCNPPYSDIRPWVEKAWSEMRRPHLERPGAVVMLLPANRTEQAWWQDLIEPYRHTGQIEVRFLRGRLRFDTPDHDYTKQPKGNRPPFGVCLVIWRRLTANRAGRMSEKDASISYCICGHLLTEEHMCPTDMDARWLRCTAMIDTRPVAAGGPGLTPCKLSEGHEGPHQPLLPVAGKVYP